MCTCALNDSEELISFGISDDWSFEQHAAKVSNLKSIYAYDYSVNFLQFLEKSTASIPKFLLRRLGVKAFLMALTLPIRYKMFFKGTFFHIISRITNYENSSIDITIDEVFSRTNSQNIFLKMDIEGTEYKVISDLMKYHERIEGLVIEFHDTSFLREKFVEALVQVAQGFDVVHVHGNNYDGSDRGDGLPHVLEISFVKKGKHDENEYILAFPKSLLDQPNDVQQEDIAFKITFI